MEVTQAVHDKILELHKLYPKATGIGLGKKIVNGVDTGEFAIQIAVPEKKPISQIPADELVSAEVDIDGLKIKTDVVEISYNIRMTCDSDCGNINPNPHNADNRATQRPLKSGIAVSSRNNDSTVGTLGGFVIHSETNGVVGLTNNHVSINDAFFTSDRDINGFLLNDAFPVNRVYNNVQGPSTPTSNNFGVSLRYVPIHSIASGQVNQVDAAICSVAQEDFSSTASWLQVGLESIMGPDAPPFASTQELDNILATNPPLYTAGYRTGAKGLEPECPLRVSSSPQLVSPICYQMQNPTQADLNLLCVDSDYAVPCTFTRSIQFVKPTQEDPNSQTPGCYNPIYSGDSGSMLLADFNGVIKIVGLVYAGSGDATGTIYGLACRIDDVADQLGIEQYVTTGGVGSSLMIDPDSVTYITIDGASDEKIIYCENEEYWQVGFTGSLEANCGPTTTTTTTPIPTTTTTSSSTSTSTSTTTTTAVPTVKLNWYLETDTPADIDTVSMEISRNGVSEATSSITTATTPTTGFVDCNTGDTIAVTITNTKAGTNNLNNRGILDGVVLLNDTSLETGSKVSTFSFTKTGATEDLEMKGNVEPTTTTTSTTTSFVMTWEFEGVEPSTTKSWRDTTLEIFNNGVTVVGPLTFDAGTPTGSGTFTVSPGDKITQSLTTDNNPSSYPQYAEHEQYKGSVSGGITLLDTDSGFIAANASKTDTLTLLTIGATPTDPKIKYKVIVTAASTSSITVDMEDIGSTAQFLSITDTTDSNIGKFFEKTSTTASDGTYTTEFFQEGHVYELEMSYQKSAPGDDDTILQTAVGAGASLVSDSDTGVAQSIIGPITTTFSPTNVTGGTITIGFSQTSP